METNRLYLRLRTKKMIQEWLDFSTQKQMNFLGINDKEELEIHLKQSKRLLVSSDRKWRLWDFVEKGSSAVIGNGGFHNWVPDHERSEIGYRLYESFRNKGYMSEAIIAIVQHGFKEMKLNRIEACISPDNVPSLKLVDKLNFKKEGQLRAHYKIGNEIHDSVIFSLLKSEYEEIIL